MSSVHGGFGSQTLPGCTSLDECHCGPLFRDLNRTSMAARLETKKNVSVSLKTFEMRNNRTAAVRVFILTQQLLVLMLCEEVPESGGPTGLS